MKEDNLYIAIYKDFIIATSTSKKKLKRYLQEIRCLDKSEYTIYEDIDDIPNIRYTMYETIESTRLHKFYKDIYITERDFRYIEEEINAVKISMNGIISNLDLLSKLFKRVNILSKEYNSITDTIKALKNIGDNDTKLEELKLSISANSIVFTENINEYIEYMLSDYEMQRLDNAYKYNLYKDD